MTQSPQPPQMPPAEPLDEAERMLARALRNLPTGSPPPELDARILGSARRAVHLAPPRKREGRRWLVGFGTAATALLAVGVMLKTHGPSPNAIITPPAETTAADGSPAPANSPTPQDRMQSMPASDKSAGQSAAAPAIEPLPPPPPPPPPRAIMQLPEAQKDMASQSREEMSASHYAEAAKVAPQAFPVVPPKSVPRQLAMPPPHAPPIISNESVPMSVPPPPAMAVMPSPPAPAAPAVEERAERKAETSDTDRRDIGAGGMAAQAPASVAGALGRTEQDLDANKQAAPVASDNALSKAKSLDEITVAGSRVKRANAPLPAPSDDAVLNPPAWIERIRERVRKGDHAGAVASLHALIAAHPETAIPDDLQSLLQ